MKKNKIEWKKIWIPKKNIKGEYEINIKGQLRNTKSKKIIKPSKDYRYKLTKTINHKKTYIDLGSISVLRWNNFKGEITSELYLRGWKRISIMYKEVGSEFFVNMYGNVYNAKLDKFHNNSISNGYYVVSINHKNYYIHRLIGLFIENETNLDYDKITIDHINKNRLDNSITNLEWVTLKENLKRSHKDRTYKRNKDGKFKS